jgi:hypothetical protein
MADRRECSRRKVVLRCCEQARRAYYGCVIDLTTEILADMNSSMIDLENARKMLDEFKALPVSYREEPTFLEIAGYYEPVCSNLLKFFFDPYAAHGLSSLFLEALLPEEGRQLSNVEVEREFPAGSKALDLVIHSATHLVGIENKIRAKPDNPFSDYSVALAGAANGREIRKFLLTLHSIGGDTFDGFQPVLYSDFLGRVRSLLGQYVAQGDTRYTLLLIDFITAIEKLQSRSAAMKPEQRKFLEEREPEVVRLLDTVKDFRAELRKKVEVLQALVNVEAYKNVTPLLCAGKGELSDTLVYKADVGEDQPVYIESWIRAKGWEIVVCHWKKGYEAPAVINALLDRFSIPHKKDGELIASSFAYDEPVERVSRHVQEIVDKIVKPASKKARAR